MRQSTTQIEAGIRQGLRDGTQSMCRYGFGPASDVVAVPLPPVEPLLDCAAAAAVLGGLHPKTVERWAREGRIPAYHYFRHWKFRASELEVWMLSHVNSLCHPCRLKQEESDGT
jgi:excisionase family DNA binding protein